MSVLTPDRPRASPSLPQMLSKGLDYLGRTLITAGTLILLFLVVHLWHFWVKSRITGLHHYGVDAEGRENLYAVMVEVFQNPVAVVIYVLGCFSLFWHLLHGFKSAFQSLGLNHKRYNPIIAAVGTAFSIIVPLVFALMPVSMFLDWIK